LLSKQNGIIRLINKISNFINNPVLTNTIYMKKLLFGLLFLFTFHTLSYAPNFKEVKERNITNCSLFTSISNIVSNIPNFDINRIPIISPIDSGSFIKVSDGFGYRFHPVKLTKIFHTGIDIASPIGTNIFATGQGYVEEIRLKKYGYGNYILINHLNGFKTRYAHLDHINVKERDIVTQGMIIATSGNTGMTTGPHLHYEIIKNNRVIDPIRFITNGKSEYMQTLNEIQKVLPLYRATV